MLNNIQVIKAMGMTEGAARLVYGETGAIQNALETVARRTERIQAFARPLRAVVQVLMMGTAAWLVLEEHRSPGIIFVTSLLFGRALAPVEGVVAGWRTFGAVRDAYRRLTDTLAAVAPALVERRSALPNPEGRLAVDNVSFCPPGRGNFLLRGISFPLNPGECLGVIGPSGAGKSLLGRLIAGVATPTIGRVTLDSVDVALWRQAAGGKHLGYLPQEVEFFGGSVGSIIARLTDTDASEVVRAAKLLGMHEDIMRLPQAYETDMNEALPALRLGQRQRIGIARACFGNPRLIVLDEPNSTLDFHGERLLFQAIEQLKACGATVVVITHRMGILPATDKIAILEAGNLVAFGRSQDIFERYLRRARIDAPSRPDPASKPPGAGHRPLPDRHRSEDAVLAAPEEGTVS
jgi:ATP-binding cassette subfamily C protein